MKSTQIWPAMAAVIIAVSACFAEAQIIHTQSTELDWDLSQGVPKLEFEPFYTILGTRTLDKVVLEFDGIVDLEVLIQNFSANAFSEDEWAYDVGANIIVAFDQKPGYEDGGPFWGLGGIYASGISGPLSAGSGGTPFSNPTPGSVDVVATASEVVTSRVESTQQLEYYIHDGDKLSAMTQPFTDFILSPPDSDPFAFISGTAVDLTQQGTLKLTYESTNLYPCHAGLPGDLTGTGAADFASFLRLSANYGMAGDYEDGDMNCDGDINFDDFLLFADYFANNDQLVAEYSASEAFVQPALGLPSATVSAASVPEPSTLWPMWLGMALALAFRRRTTNA